MTLAFQEIDFEVFVHVLQLLKLIFLLEIGRRRPNWASWVRWLLGLLVVWLRGVVLDESRTISFERIDIGLMLVKHCSLMNFDRHGFHYFILLLAFIHNLYFKTRHFLLADFLPLVVFVVVFVDRMQARLVRHLGKGLLSRPLNHLALLL